MYKFTNYTRGLVLIINECKIYSTQPPHLICFCLNLFFKTPFVVLKPGRYGSTGKGTVFKVLLEEVLMLCSFLPSQFQPKPPYKNCPKSRALWYNIYPNSLCFCLMIRPHFFMIKFYNDKDWRNCRGLIGPIYIFSLSFSFISYVIFSYCS